MMVCGGRRGSVVVALLLLLVLLLLVLLLLLLLLFLGGSSEASSSDDDGFVGFSCECMRGVEGQHGLHAVRHLDPVPGPIVGTPPLLEHLVPHQAMDVRVVCHPHHHPGIAAATTTSATITTGARF